MAKKTFLDFEPYPKYKNCFVNSEVMAMLKSGDSICHYMPYSRLEDWINNLVMTFVSPSRWEDPFEKIYLHTTLLNLPNEKEYHPPRMACLCFTKSSFKDSAAFWKSFKINESTQLVRVIFDFKLMMAQLVKALEKQKMNVKIYVAAIDYSLSQESILDPKDLIKHIKKKSRSHQIEAESLYLKMLSCKRKAFDFENEIRVFLVPQNGEIKFNRNGCFEVKEMNYRSIIKKVWLEPIRLPMGWVSEDFAKESLKKIRGKIHQSRLYDKQQKCKKIDWLQITTRERG